MSETAHHYLYVMASSQDGPVKIGRAGSPAKRLRDLQPGHPQKLKVWHAVRMSETNAVRMESGLHRKLARHRQSGEWFNLRVWQAIHEAHRMCKYLHGSLELSVSMAAKHDDLLVYPQGQEPWACISAVCLLGDDPTAEELAGWLPARWIARMT
jgi:predicted GIY-YIG superfamily endonuclease